MSNDLMLIPNPDLRSEAMSLAHEIRESEGVDMGTALERAWSEVRGESDYDNPLTDREATEMSAMAELQQDDWQDTIAKYSKPRRKANNPDGEGLSILVLAAIGYGIWAAIKKSWTPWKGLTLGRPIRAISLAPSNTHRDMTSEVVRLIVP